MNLKISGFEIPLEEATKIINKNRYKRVALQIPEGLKIHFAKILDFMEKETQTNFIVSADPCFGACDVVGAEFKNLGVDFVVQIGHTPIPRIAKLEIPHLFISAISDLNVTKIVEKAIPLIKGKRVGLVSTAQHVHMLDTVYEILTKNKFEPIIGKGDGRIALGGQVLGCNFSAATSIKDKVDLFLYIGDGNFHPLGLILSTKKPVIVCDPYTNEVREKELDNLKDMILRQRYGAIARSRDARVFGILVGTKRGQGRVELAYNLKKNWTPKKEVLYFCR